MCPRVLRAALVVWVVSCVPSPSSPDAGPTDAGLDADGGGVALAALFTSGQLNSRAVPRVARAPIALAHHGGRRFTLWLGVDPRQDTSRRLDVVDETGAGWALDEQPGERQRHFS
jgi:hypothetical protein